MPPVGTPNREDVEAALDSLTSPAHPKGPRHQARARWTIEAYIAGQEGEDLPAYPHEPTPRGETSETPPGPPVAEGNDEAGTSTSEPEAAESEAESSSDEPRQAPSDESSEASEEETEAPPEPEGDEIQTSTGEGGSLEDAPGT